jgi:hypothetical protein
MSFDPGEIAVLYYFGDLHYWKMPEIAVDALEQGYDGRALRNLAGLVNQPQPTSETRRSMLRSGRWEL